MLVNRIKDLTEKEKQFTKELVEAAWKNTNLVKININLEDMNE